jgi:hypothetical protein
VTKPNRYWSPKRGEGETAQWLFDRVNYDGDECLIWPFSTVRGYGNFGFEGEQHYAHRFMCGLVNGPPPSPEHHAAHSCNRGEEGCVHPKHLDWKTPSQNQLDKREAGTLYKGGRKRKLKPADVITIRSLKGIETHDAIASRFGVSRRTIGAIFDRRSHVISLNRDKIAEALKASGRPMEYREIAAAAGIAQVKSVAGTLSRMVRDGEITKVEKTKYTVQSTTTEK